MENNERPILTVIQDIKSGSISAKALDKETRMQCVETLMCEGYPVPQIAQVLDRSEKTIRRDIVLVRERNSINPNVDLAKRLIGDLIMKAETHSSFLMRLARSREGSVGERVQAEYLAWKTTDELMKLLQSMGFLPLKPKEVVGDFVHHMTGSQTEKSFEELKGVLGEILSVAEEAETSTPELQKSVDVLSARLEKTKIEYETNKLLSEQKDVQNKEDKNERNI